MRFVVVTPTTGDPVAEVPLDDPDDWREAVCWAYVASVAAREERKARET